MTGKRKDHKGRILKTGESQRPDGRYQFRFADPFGNRKTVYAATLQELRAKEDEIKKQSAQGKNYVAALATVSELVDRYISLEQGVRYTTRHTYAFVKKLVDNDPFGKKAIGEVRVSDARQWMLQLHLEGRKYGTISDIKGVMRPAFQMAYNDEIISRNPFDFKLVDIVANDSQKKVALTEEQQKLWMDFISQNSFFRRYYDELVILLETGLRVSEFCGLTKSDLDFKERRIRVDHQLQKKKDGTYYIEKTKSASGCRYIPMTEKAYRSLKKILAKRQKPKVEPMIDGYSAFILLNELGQPKVAKNLQNSICSAQKKYNRLYPDHPLPHITPHVLRHTFCTNMANAGIDVKNLQYLMGHANVGITLDVYTHSSYTKAAEQMARIIPFNELQEEKNERRKSV